VLDHEEGAVVLTRQRGFTLPELLVTLAIAAIGATLAAPSVSQMVASRRVQTAAQSILDGLNLARADALRRNTAVRFALNPASNGWTLVQVASGDTLQSYTSSDWSALVITPSAGVGSVTFLANGLRATGTQLSQVTVASPVDKSGMRRINVFGGGLIRMCDPAITAADDPRRC
jgi:type IV fimbrial biogenesis protein FimT